MTLEKIKEIIIKNDINKYQEFTKQYKNSKNIPGLLKAREHIYIEFSNPEITFGENNEMIHEKQTYALTFRDLFDEPSFSIPFEEIKKIASNNNYTDINLEYVTNYYVDRLYYGSTNILYKSLKINELDNIFYEEEKILKKKYN